MSELREQMAEQPRSRATIFGVPIGELGFFTSVLFGCVLGFGAFFLTTFVGIVSIFVYNSNAGAHAPVNFAYSYLRFGMPVGILVAVVVWVYLGRLWVARITSRQ
jgi:hypothetical protein